AFLTRETMEHMGIAEENTEGLINHLRSIKGVEVAVFFYQLATGHTKVGLRSKNRVDVNRLAGRFGGGGHVRAAGCTLPGDMQQIMEKVVAAAVEAVGAGD
ncbi:MAG: DHH family phosphoesterase, partial [Bacillota bacterium]